MTDYDSPIGTLSAADQLSPIADLDQSQQRCPNGSIDHSECVTQDERLDLARRLADGGDWQAVIDVAGTITESSIDRLAAATLLLRAYDALSDAEGAREVSRYIFERRPTNFDSFQDYAARLAEAGLDHERLAVCALRQGLIDTAISLLPKWTDDGTHCSAYLDLLERAILNTIYRDGSSFNGRTSGFELDQRLVGSDKPALAHSMIGQRRLRQLRRAVETVCAEGLPGDLIETGVWRGGACILMRGVLKDLGDQQRRVYAADSFEGLPPPDPRYQEDALSLIDFHTVKDLMVDQETVEENFRRYDLLDDRVVFVKGYFSQTLGALRDRSFAILRLDGDLYSSTMDALEALYDSVVPGGFVIVDDYGSVLDAQRAVLDFRHARGIEDPIIAIDNDGVFWRKAIPHPA